MSLYVVCVVTAGSGVPEELSPVFHATPFFVTAQLVTCEEDHEIEVAPEPVATRVGLALIDTVGCSTVTVAIAELGPPIPVQVIP